MQIEQVQVGKLIPYANNARTHTEAQVAQIAASIREFGFNNPILIDEQSTIIAGHGRVLAAQALELKEVPCIRLTHLTPSQRKAYVIADNKIENVKQKEYMTRHRQWTAWGDIQAVTNS